MFPNAVLQLVAYDSCSHASPGPAIHSSVNATVEPGNVQPVPVASFESLVNRKSDGGEFRTGNSRESHLRNCGGFTADKRQEQQNEGNCEFSHLDRVFDESLAEELDCG